MSHAAPASTLRFGKPIRVAGLIVGAFLLFQWVQQLAAMDPFARFRRAEIEQLGSMVGLRMDNVRLRFFDGAKQVGSCLVQRLDMQKNRQYLDFYGVKEGVYQSPRGDFRYFSSRAQWDANRSRLQVLSGAYLKNQEMNLTADAFEYNQSASQLFVPGKIRGTLFGGQVDAERFTYSMADGSYDIGPVHWVGMASLSAQETGGDAAAKSRWDFKAKGAKRGKNSTTEIWIDAQATDGDVIVKAPKIERDVKTDVLTATGKVFYFSAKVNMSCDKAVVYRGEKRALLSGSVQMILKPKENQKVEVAEIPPFHPQVPDDIAKDRPPAPPSKAESEKKLDEELRGTSSARKYPIAIFAEKIEYWYAKGQRHAVISGNPQARQDLASGRWRYAWTHQAFYDGEKETLKMVSTEGQKDTRVKNSLGDDLVATWFQLSTQEDNDEWEGDGLEGGVFADENEVPKTGGTKTGAGSGAGTSGTGAGDKKNGGGKGSIRGPIGRG